MAKTVKAKTSATKTTTKKTTTAKKTATTKATAKKTTATKPSAKTTTAEITVSGNKKIATLQKEFNKKSHIFSSVSHIVMLAMQSKKATLSVILMARRLLHLCGVQIPADPFLFPATRKSKLWKKSSTLYSAYIAKYATTTQRAIHITPAEHLTK